MGTDIHQLIKIKFSKKKNYRKFSPYGTCVYHEVFLIMVQSGIWGKIEIDRIRWELGLASRYLKREEMGQKLMYDISPKEFKKKVKFYFKKDIGIGFSPSWACCQFRTFESFKHFSRSMGIESPSRFEQGNPSSCVESWTLQVDLVLSSLCLETTQDCGLFSTLDFPPIMRKD